MPTFTVHAPPPPKDGTTSAPERFLFVRDGFHGWAFILGPLWLLVHRLWLALVICVAVYAAIGVGLALLHAPASVQLIVGVVIALLMGFEASSIWRWTLARRRWTMLGFVVGEDVEMAERRFYGAWAKRIPEPPLLPPTLPEQPQYVTPIRRGPPSGNDVIGLFPEPGGTR